MYTILLCVDRDGNQTQGQIETIADLPHGADELHVIVYHVFTNNPEGASAQQLSTVKTATTYLEEREIETEINESSGDPVAEIIDAAAEFDVDLICLGGRKRSPAGKAIFGSVTQGVILNSDRAILCSPVS